MRHEPEVVDVASASVPLITDSNSRRALTVQGFDAGDGKGVQWLLRDADGRTVGFSTQRLLAEIPGTGGARFLFSGDTIVAPEHWNTPYLAGCFGHLMLRLIREHPRTPLYWFLISKGFRTYRFLPVFFARFWPDPRSPAPPGGAELLRTVAAWKFGACYDAADGLVKDAAGDRLAEPLAAVPEAKRRDPHTRFFLERNPQYALGHELA